MYRTIQSPVTLAVGPLAGREPGLQPHQAGPVLCAGALIAAATFVGRAVTSAVQESVQSAAENDSQTQTECPDAASDFATSALYVPPGRLSADGHRVADNASVDDLISAAGGDRPGA